MSYQHLKPGNLLRKIQVRKNRENLFNISEILSVYCFFFHKKYVSQSFQHFNFKKSQSQNNIDLDFNLLEFCLSTFPEISKQYLQPFFCMLTLITTCLSGRNPIDQDFLSISLKV